MPYLGKNKTRDQPLRALKKRNPFAVLTLNKLEQEQQEIRLAGHKYMQIHPSPH